MASTMDVHERRLELLDFAIGHGWVIDPGKGLEVHLENAIKFDRCPCDPKRPRCPCPESVNEVPSTGHCRCRLYYKDLATFRKEMRPAKRETHGRESVSAD